MKMKLIRMSGHKCDLHSNMTSERSPDVFHEDSDRVDTTDIRPKSQNGQEGYEDIDDIVGDNLISKIIKAIQEALPEDAGPVHVIARKTTSLEPKSLKEIIGIDEDKDNSTMQQM